eukprot:14899814-Alexandrium_andersonii.AAC.1
MGASTRRGHELGKIIAGLHECEKRAGRICGVRAQGGETTWSDWENLANGWAAVCRRAERAGLVTAGWEAWWCPEC